MKKLFWITLLICATHISFSQEMVVAMADEQDYYQLKTEKTDSLYTIVNEHNKILFSGLDTAYFDNRLSLFFIKKHNKWGIVSKFGAEQLACKYDTITNLISLCLKVSQNNAYGVVNFKTPLTFIIPVEFDDISSTSIIGKEIIVTKNGRNGVYNLDGEKVLDTKYSSIKQKYGTLVLSEGSKTTYSVGDSVWNDSIIFDKTFRIYGNTLYEATLYYVFYKETKLGVINSSCEIIIPAQYTDITYRKRIKTAEKKIIDNPNYIYLLEDSQWGAFDIKQGTLVIPCKYATIEELETHILELLVLKK